MCNALRGSDLVVVDFVVHRSIRARGDELVQINFFQGIKGGNEGNEDQVDERRKSFNCLLYTSPSPRD